MCVGEKYFSAIQYSTYDPPRKLTTKYIFADAKRLIGRKYNDSSIQSDMKHWPFRVIDDSSKPKIQVEYKVMYNIL